MRFDPRIAAAAVAVFVGAAWLGYRTTAAAPPSVSFLSVGQGDCIVVRDGSTTILIDAGPGSGEFDAGARLIVPKLRAMGVSRIDLVLLSHPDEDHIGGLSGIAKRMPVAKVAYPAHFAGSQEMKSELAEAGIGEKSRLQFVRGGTIELGRTSLKLVVPEWSEGQAENDGSMFVVLDYEGSKAIFTGDASEETELKMVLAADWDGDVLKAGHHGSRFSTSAAWLRRTSPKWVVFSCGRANSYGHPSPETLERVKATGAQTISTAESGDIRFVARANGWNLER